MFNLAAQMDSDFGRHGGRMGHRGEAVGMLLCVVAALALIAGLFWLLRRRKGAPTPAAFPAPVVSPTTQAENILAERFARGEIAVDEFTQRRAALRGEVVTYVPTSTPAAADSTEM